MPNDATRRAQAEGAIVVVVHPPERGHRRGSVPVQAGACCCSCCCCCLHSLGGLIGAAVASNMAQGDPNFRPYVGVLDRWNEEEPRAWAPTANSEAISAQDPSAPPAVSLPFRVAPRSLVKPTSGPSAVSLFWWVLLGLIGFGALVSPAFGADGCLVCAVIIALVLPGLQFLAVVVVMIVLLVSARQDKSYQLWKVGKILLGSVVGAGAGFLIMVGLYVCMNH